MGDHRHIAKVTVVIKGTSRGAGDCGMAGQVHGVGDHRCGHIGLGGGAGQHGDAVGDAEAQAAAMAATGGDPPHRDVMGDCDAAQISAVMARHGRGEMLPCCQVQGNVAAVVHIGTGQRRGRADGVQNGIGDRAGHRRHGGDETFRRIGMCSALHFAGDGPGGRVGVRGQRQAQYGQFMHQFIQHSGKAGPRGGKGGGAIPIRPDDQVNRPVLQVQAISWQELTVLGKSAHAGTTPMVLRKDAGLAAAKINVHLHEMTSSGEFGEDMRVTMGRIEPVPGRVNIVPAKLVCTVDLRNPEDEAMERAEAAIAAYLEELSAQMGIVIEARQTARTQRVRFDEQTQALIERKMSARGYRSQRILSGAGHDAQEFAAVCPSAMIFVPGEYDGISHNPREFSSKEACGKGVRVLYDVILELAGGG